MSDRITEPGENASEEETPKEVKTTTSKYVNAPKDYINPFENYQQGQEYPDVFSDIDFELKQNPHMFSKMDELKVLQTESKSEIVRIWQHNRWKTWKYLEEQPKEQVVMIRNDGEREDARGTVSINGVTYYMIKGVEVIVPKDVKEIVLTSQNQTSIAGRESLLSSLAKKIDPETNLPKSLDRLER